MGAFNTAVITDAGEVLLAKIIAGTETLNLTSAKTSDYEYPAETSFKALTDLQGIKQTMANPTAQVLSDTVIGVQALFGNQDVEQAYDIWNIGLYAMDGDNEILFSISSAQTPDQMPAFEGVAPSSYIYDIRLAVSQAADITIEVNPAGTVTQEQLATKVTANGGNIGDTVVNFDDSGSVPDITSFPAFLATLVSGSKIGTFFRNFLAGAQFLLHVGSIVNNCVTDNPELPLSAAQGKVLMDLYTVLNTKAQNMGTIIYVDGTVDNICNEIITICTVNLPAGSRYLLLGIVNASISFEGIMSASIESYTTRTTTSSGGGCVVYNIATNGGTYSLKTNGYYEKSFSFMGRLLAI